MKLTLYYVIRKYNEDSIRYDSGPHQSYMDASLARDEDHRWDAEKYDIFETILEGVIT